MFVLINPSDITQTLSGYASNDNGQGLLTIPGSSWNDALTELTTNISSEAYIYSSTLNEESGSVTGIGLPKRIIES